MPLNSIVIKQEMCEIPVNEGDYLVDFSVLILTTEWTVHLDRRSLRATFLLCLSFSLRAQELPLVRH